MAIYEDSAMAALFARVFGYLALLLEALGYEHAITRQIGVVSAIRLVTH